MFSLCNKISSSIKSLFSKKEIKTEVKDFPVNSNDSVEINVNKEPISITITKPQYEYAHGKRFKNDYPKWIVIHYTACANVSAKAMCKAMRKNTGASSHFYIDEKDICSAVPLKYIAWHVGDGKCKQPNSCSKMSLDELSKYKSKDWRYDLAASNHLKWQSNSDDFTGNSVSIGVDICVKKKSTKTTKATDTDWYFEDKAIDNLAKTVAHLMQEYNIDINHVITHCMATGKLCPQPFVWPPEKGDKQWELFKEKVKSYKDSVIKVTIM
jgi:N-acetylmuramoyl-L-alanine amidase CwlA